MNVFLLIVGVINIYDFLWYFNKFYFFICIVVKVFVDMYEEYLIFLIDE